MNKKQWAILGLFTLIPLGFLILIINELRFDYRLIQSEIELQKAKAAYEQQVRETK